MDLKIKDVAELLNVSETTIRRWLSEGKIPAYKLHHQYRFSRIEIENWMMSFRHKKKNPVKETQIYPEGEVTSPGSQQFSLYRAVNRGAVFCEDFGPEKEQIIRGAMGKIAKTVSLDAEGVAELLLDRERLAPTALSNGLAVPHTRDFLLSGHFDAVSVLYLPEPIEWGALDGVPTHTLFFLFASNDKRHLHLLAKIAHISSDPNALKFLQSRPEKEALLDFIKSWETTI